MSVENMIRNLTDPLGIPFYPFIFQFLMILTFTLHILFVNLTLGSSFFALYGYVRRDGYWMRLYRTMIRTFPVSISIAILMGVAPLLFVQVLYDPFWYTSSALSAWWVIIFVISLMVAYSFGYLFYFKGEGKGPFSVLGVISFLLLLLAGFIMHSLNYQLLQPSKWVSYFVKGGRIDASGLHIHSFKLTRLIHFIIPSFAVTGIYLMLYSRYYSERSNLDANYLKWTGEVGAKLAFYATLVQVIAGVLWVLTEPFRFRFYLHPAFFISTILGLLFVYYLYIARREPQRSAYTTALFLIITVFAMSYTREFLRMKYLSEVGFSIFTRKVTLDIGSTLLFLLTFIFGLVVILYLLSISYLAGKSEGVMKASEKIERWGNLSIFILILWLVVMVTFGAILSIKFYL